MSERATRPHESLEVCRLARALALRVHAVTLKLPKHEMYVERHHDPARPDSLKNS